jgi:hypothetical protein
VACIVTASPLAVPMVLPWKHRISTAKSVTVLRSFKGRPEVRASNARFRRKVMTCAKPHDMRKNALPGPQMWRFSQEQACTNGSLIRERSMVNPTVGSSDGVNMQDRALAASPSIVSSINLT